MTLEEAQGEAIGIWPDNLLATNTFISMSTQWRTGGMGGPIGLDYNALPAVLSMSAVKRSQWPDIFECIRILEDAALETMRKNK